MKVLIADPQTTVRHALSVWISGQPGWNVVGESSNSYDLLDKLTQLSAEVIIMDRDLPGLSSKELVTRIRQESKEVAIILLFNNSMEQFHPDNLDVDYCASKIDPPTRMLEAILKARRRYESNPSSKKEVGPSKIKEKRKI
jgi:DNA-binding NarL/FixJ family response regulator